MANKTIILSSLRIHIIFLIILTTSIFIYPHEAESQQCRLVPYERVVNCFYGGRWQPCPDGDTVTEFREVCDGGGGSDGLFSFPMLMAGIVFFVIAGTVIMIVKNAGHKTPDTDTYVEPTYVEPTPVEPIDTGPPTLPRGYDTPKLLGKGATDAPVHMPWKGMIETEPKTVAEVAKHLQRNWEKYDKEYWDKYDWKEYEDRLNKCLKLKNANVSDIDIEKFVGDLAISFAHSQFVPGPFSAGTSVGITVASHFGSKIAKTSSCILGSLFPD